MIDSEYVAITIEDLNIKAHYCDQTGHRKMSEIMRRAARLLAAMQREAAIKSVAQEIIKPIIEHVEITDG